MRSESVLPPLTEGLKKENLSGKRMIREIVAVPGALFRPDRAFAERNVYRLPRSILLLTLFVCYTIGERLVQGFFQNAHAKTLALLGADAQLSALLANAPAQMQAQARSQMLSSILGQGSTMITALGIVLAGVGFLAVCAELWLVTMVASQFFGGQEDRHARPRPSWVLFQVAFIPLALRKLLSGLLLMFGSAAAASNALTLSDYRRLSMPKLDFYSLLSVRLPWPFFEACLRFLSDPFFLWTCVILCLGGRAVYRIPLRNVVALVLVLVLLLSLQSALLARLGISWEI
jgi:hypothetical protein